jgi:hypothetical protein
MKLLRRVSEGVARGWCHTMHPAPMWPIHGEYRCRRCLRQHPVPWEIQHTPTKADHARLITSSEKVQLSALPPAA